MVFIICAVYYVLASGLYQSAVLESIKQSNPTHTHTLTVCQLPPRCGGICSHICVCMCVCCMSVVSESVCKAL